MKTCPNCNTNVTDETKFCPNCGAQLPNEESVQYEKHQNRPPKRKSNTLLIVGACAVAAVIFYALLAYFFIWKNDKNKEVAETEQLEEPVQENQYAWLSDRLVKASDLEGKTAGDLRLMRNAIFARHGYIFKSDDLKEYFSEFDWYVPRYADVTDRLSSIEQKNITFIQKYEGNAPSKASSSSVAHARLHNIGLTDDYSDIVCYVKLSDSDLRDLSKSELRILRNTIYARHGRKFKSKDLDRYFNSFSWYNGVYDEIPVSWLSDIEKHNINLIQRFE